MTTRLGMVGAGGMAAERVRCFASLDTAEVAGVWTRNPDKLQAFSDENGVPAFPSVEAMVPEVDALVLCLPNHLHTEYALTALRHGKHVLVEYPLCITRSEADQLVAAAQEAGTVLMVGNTIIHEAMFQAVAAARERLGSLLSGASRVSFYGDDIAGSWYLDEAKAGPPFVCFHYHHIEYYRRLLGEVAWVLANDDTAASDGGRDQTVRAGGTLVLGHQCGATSCIQWYLHAEGDGLPRGFWLNGAKASLTVVSEQSERSRIIWDGGGEDKVEWLEDDWGIDGSCQDFVDAIEGRLDADERLQSDLRTLAVGWAAVESARDQRVVRTDLP